MSRLANSMPLDVVDQKAEPNSVSLGCGIVTLAAIRAATQYEAYAKRSAYSHIRAQ